MPNSTGYYLPGVLAIFTGDIDCNSNTFKTALLTNVYTPDLDTHQYFSSLTGEVVGTGYTAGGATLASVTVTATLADSWSFAWGASTAYAVGKIVRPSTGNGYVYRCVVAGTSHATTEPTWPEVFGKCVSDNGVTWTCFGRAVVTFDAADVSWTNSTMTAYYAVVYQSTGAAATSRLVFLQDFQANKTTTNTAFQITWDAQGIFHVGVP